MCAFSLFDFDRYGDERFAADRSAVNGNQDRARHGGSGGGGGGRRRRVVTEQGKMEKSFLSFKHQHPEWTCGPGGDRFIERLSAFQVRQTHPLKGGRALRAGGRSAL